MNFELRKMNVGEIDFAIELAAEQGWNPGLNDGNVFYNTDPNGFFIALLDNNPIGCISAVNYDDKFGFVGFYIVKPEYESDVFGVRLGMKAANYLRNLNVGIDGVLERQANYERIGFKYAYQNARYEAEVQFENKNDANLIPIAEVPFEQIAKYDEHCFPAKRIHFLKNWLNMSNASSWAYLEDGVVKGFGVIRQCRSGYKVAPLFADNQFYADAILNKLLSTCKNGKFYLDIPKPNLQGQFFIEKYKMEKVFATARMYNKEIPRIDLNKIFSVTSYELG